MDHADADTVCPELFIQIGKRVPEAAEQHDLVVGQVLLVPDDFTQGFQFRVVGVEGARFFYDRLNLRTD